ncbi:MAG: cytochrome c oxidase subunit 2A [Chitinophagaceae bacterium]|nr:cytochrome c oxidase subunit 2A [Chitinophagaceae bacterium]
MEFSPGRVHESAPTEPIREHDNKFFPSGAIAFFILLVILCLIIWFGVYFLMIERS